jgi:hypothetical protein
MLITRILAVYLTRPVMIVAEMEEGIILELSLPASLPLPAAPDAPRSAAFARRVAGPEKPDTVYCAFRRS